MWSPLYYHLYDAASGANTTENLARWIIAEGESYAVAADADAPIPERSTGAKGSGNGRAEILLTIENQGTAAAYLVRPEDIPGTDETAPLTPWVINPGETVELGPWSWATWELVLRQLDGAQCLAAAAWRGQR